jgi:hypothetical protein
MPVRAGKLMKRKIYWTFYSLMASCAPFMRSSIDEKARKTVAEQRRIAAERERRALEICQVGKELNSDKSRTTADYNSGRDFSLQSLKVDVDKLKPRAASRTVSFLLPQAPTINLVSGHCIELN